MNDEQLMTQQAEDDVHPRPSNRKPRLILMGEFSAGKSTLSNILLGSQPLPMRVTATRLPPVKISYGEPAAFAIGMDGKRTRLDLDNLETVSLYETEMIELTTEAEPTIAATPADEMSLEVEPPADAVAMAEGTGIDDAELVLETEVEAPIAAEEPVAAGLSSDVIGCTMASKLSSISPTESAFP